MDFVKILYKLHKIVVIVIGDIKYLWVELELKK